MKVLHLFNEIKFSGAEIMYANAASTFQKEGIKLIAFSTGQKLGEFAAKFKDEDIDIYHKPIQFYPFTIEGIKYYLKLYKFTKNEEIDVFHVHRNDLYFVAFIAWLANIKCVKTQHNNFKNRWFTWPVAVLRRFIIRKLFDTSFQTIGESVHKNELEYYKNPSIKINNWFDDDRFYPPTHNKESQKIRRDLDLDDADLVIISVGGCSYVKRHHHIIKAMSILPKDLNVKYLHLGSGHTEDEEKKLAEDLGLGAQVNFLGNQNNVRDYLIASDVHIMPSKYEGLSIASIEAMACGLPSILYDVSGLKDLIKDNDNGFLIEEDYKLLAEKIITYYENPEIAKVKVDNAYTFVNQEFAMGPNVAQIIELYKHA